MRLGDRAGAGAGVEAGPRADTEGRKGAGARGRANKREGKRDRRGWRRGQGGQEGVEVVPRGGGGGRACDSLKVACSVLRSALCSSSASAMAFLSSVSFVSRSSAGMAMYFSSSAW